MPGLQMSLEHLALIAAVDADDVIGINRASNRHCRNTRRFFDDLVAKAAQRRMDSIDKAPELVGRDEVLPHIRRDDPAREAPLVFDAHLRKILYRLVDAAVVGHARRYEAGLLEVNLARILKCSSWRTSAAMPGTVVSANA